jgi:hypothetical protein
MMTLLVTPSVWHTAQRYTSGVSTMTGISREVAC